MATLANTTWEIIFGDIPAFSVNFKLDGSAAVMFPKGSSTTAFWTETPDGSFILQSSRAKYNPAINEVFYGMYGDSEGFGHLCEIGTYLHDFMMKRR